jgi:subfamily B ATP-binding cassette protein MsbA
MFAEKKSRPKASKVWAEAKTIIWTKRWRLSLGLVLVFINRIAGLVFPASPMILIDEIVGKEQAHLLPRLAMLLGCAALVQAGTSFALSQILGIAGQDAIMDMRKRIQQHIIRLPTHYFDSTKSGVLVSRVMTDPEGIRNLVGTGLVQVIGGLVTASVSLSFLFYLNWQITVVTMAILVVFGLCMAATFKRLRPIFRERGAINAQVTGRLTESLGGIRIVKGYTAEDREDGIFAEGINKLFKNVSGAITGVSAISAITTAIMGVIGVVMVLMGGRALLAGDMEPGAFMTYVGFTALTVMPIAQIASITTQFSEAFAGLDRIRDVRSTPTEADEDEGREAVDGLRGDVRFDKVCFEYKPGVPVLKDISFEAGAGSTTALVGSSGSGKSTLIGLVMAFHHPGSGVVSIDGKNLQTLRLRDYRSHLGIVLQEDFLFDGTVAENIAFSRPDASRETIEEVSKVAHCAEFIEEFEEGYDTVVGERGVKLSGGQRQRIAIARALLANPQILILDEATSSLDSESEGYIQEGLQSLRAGRTTFVIAHRLSTIQSADQILVLEEGEIFEQGTHDELLSLDGRYKELYDKQYRLEMNRFTNPGEELTSGYSESN